MLPQLEKGLQNRDGKWPQWPDLGTWLDSPGIPAIWGILSNSLHVFSGLFLKWLFKTCFPFFLFHKPYSPPTTGIYLRRDWGGRAFPHETGSRQNSWLTRGPSDHRTYCHIEEGFSTFPISEHFKHRKSCLLTKHKAGFALSYTQESIYCAFVKGWATSRCCLLLFFDANS